MVGVCLSAADRSTDSGGHDQRCAVRFLGVGCRQTCHSTFNSLEATCVSNHELGQLRAEIDDLDEQIIKLLGQRFIATGKVGVIKAAQSLEPIDPAREAAQAQRYSELAERYGVDVKLTQRLFRSVIDEVVANHRVIRENAS